MIPPLAPQIVIDAIHEMLPQALMSQDLDHESSAHRSIVAQAVLGQFGFPSRRLRTTCTVMTPLTGETFDQAGRFPDYDAPEWNRLQVRASENHEVLIAAETSLFDFTFKGVGPTAAIGYFVSTLADDVKDGHSKIRWRGDVGRIEYQPWPGLTPIPATAAHGRAAAGIAARIRDDHQPA